MRGVTPAAASRLSHRSRRSGRPALRSSICSWKCRCTPLCTAFFTLLAASVGLITASIWFFVDAAEHRREHLLDEYKLGIQRWNEFRSVFAALRLVSVRRSGDDREAGLTMATLQPDTKPDEFQDYEERQGFEELPEYDALVYRLTGVPHGFVPTESIEFEDQHVAGTRHKLVMPGTSFDLSVDDEGVQSTFTVGPYPLLTVMSLPSHQLYPSETSCRPQATFFMGSCWTIRYLERICVQIAPADAARRWRLSRRSAYESSSGCDFADGKWEVPVYRDHPTGGESAGEILNTVGLGTNGTMFVPHRITQTALARLAAESLTVEVRATTDPYLTAMEITRGSLDFGMSATDEQEWGQALLLLGIVALLPPCGVVAIRRCVHTCDKAGAYQSDTDGEDELFRNSIGRRYSDANNDD